jgi:hypothetical protein
VYSVHLAFKEVEQAAMMNQTFSSLDRHAVLCGSDDGFPWFAGAMLAMESCEVVSLRLAKFADHDEDFEREAGLMMSEKIFAAFEAGANWLAGASPASIITRYREHVAANARRLSQG